MNKLKKITWFDIVILFGVPTILNYIATHIAMPNADNLYIMPIEVTYFLSVGLIVLAPMFFGAIYLSGKNCSS